MRVVFYKADGTAIANKDGQTEIAGKHLGQMTQANETTPFVSGKNTEITNAAGHWYRFAIPNDAAAFEVHTSDNSKKSDQQYEILTKRTSVAPRKQNYTLGGMQYRIEDSGTGTDPTEYALLRFYPEFTQTDAPVNPYSPPDEPVNTTDTQSADAINTANGAPLTRYADIEDFAALPTASTPSFTGNIPSDTPVLYATNSDTVSYGWTEGIESFGPENNSIWFDNSHQGWGQVYAYFYGDAGSKASAWPGERMTLDTGKGLYSVTVPGDYTHVIFNQGNDVGQIEIALDSAHYFGRSCVYHPAYTTVTPITSGAYIYFKEPTGGRWNNTETYLWKGSSNSGWTDSGNSQTVYSTTDSSSYGNVKPFYIGTSSNYEGAVFRYKDGYSQGKFRMKTHDITLKSTHGEGELWQVDTCYDDGWNEVSYTACFVDYVTHGTTSNVDAVLDDPVVIQTGSSTSYTSTYQPEDRYGYINNVTNHNGDDGNTFNYVTINTGISTPYIRFYSTTNGTGAVIGGVDKGIDLENAKLNGLSTVGTKIGADQYRVRLPKNARSFTIGDGTNYSAVKVLDDSKAYTYAATVSGTTITISEPTDRNISSANTAVPVFKTDFDYIYFTDTDNWKSSSDTNRIYAYYYGGADGEYNAWPGVPATGSYTDNSGKTVYIFQPPTETADEKVYPYVIFNNGSANDRKITQAINYSMGNVYTPTSSSTSAYGSITSAAVKADNLPINKAQSETAGSSRAEYTKYTPDEKYIYIVNNGTQNVSDLSDTNRYQLDEMHITFFSDAEGTVVGTASPGYYADKLEYGNYNGI